MHKADVQAMEWSDRQAEACEAGNCKYYQPLEDKPTAKDSTQCHGWHGTRVQTMREGVVTSEAIRYRRCARFVAWIDATGQRKARREGSQPRAATPKGWGA